MTTSEKETLKVQCPAIAHLTELFNGNKSDWAIKHKGLVLNDGSLCFSPDFFGKAIVYEIANSLPINAINNGHTAYVSTYVLRLILSDTKKYNYIRSKVQVELARCREDFMKDLIDSL